jgi:DNA repair photolyase
MNIKEIKSKSIITKSGLPGVDFVINPYTGCSHSCKYCYARFMKKFTNHQEPWGCFVDVKVNAPDLITNTDKYENKSIVIGSVTDPYLSLESKYELTRSILKKLIPLNIELSILTKSDLILRDIDLIKQLKDCTVSISASFLNEEVKDKLEKTIPTKRRVEALKKLKEEGIRTRMFISPIFPYISDWKELVEMSKDFVDEFWFENLNLYPYIQKNVFDFLKEYDKDLIKKYEEIYFEKNNYWNDLKEEIKDFCDKEGVKYRTLFH